MPELTEQEKLERRRQKRQQRILASAGNRLSKITGTAFRETSPTPSPSTSASSIALAEPQHRDLPRSRSPSPAVFGGGPLGSSTSSDAPRSIRRASDADPSEALGAPPPLEDTLDAMFSSSSSLFGLPSPAGGAGEPNLNDLLGGQFPFNPAFLANMQQQPQEQTVDPSNKYWNLLHFVSMIWLGFYAVYVEWTTAGSERFASLLSSNPRDEGNLSYPAIHFAARMLYQQGHMNTNSTLGSIAAQLPPPFSIIITVILRYRLIWSCLVQDCCILVFVIGLAEVLSAVL
ncbi:hypothetical protein DFQ30_001453 [Apophysomyces sp. BC1015]|nr:hypothetical protein DFQ30_001453 [Apophysomyces sp. BC1015]